MNLINTVINSDTLALIKNMDDESIDLVVTDPPYKVISGGKPHKKGQPSGMLSKNDGKIFKHNDIKPELWIPEIYRILKNGTHCYIMTNTINLENYLRICREVGFGLHNVLCWEKNNVTPSRWYMKNCEFTLFLRKGKAKTINNVGSKMVHQFNNIIGNKTHPCEKPVDLMKFYIANSSNEEDIVFDPFCGTGSTLIAAKELNRKYLGCEIDEEYFNIAIKRIENMSR
jgi:site-specific DNA-methyltransferase (adenine-specific)